jgi:hypothetical protein
MDAIQSWLKIGRDSEPLPTKQTTRPRPVLATVVVGACESLPLGHSQKGSISAYYIACLNQVLTGPYCCFQTGPPSLGCHERVWPGRLTAVPLDPALEDPALS